MRSYPGGIFDPMGERSPGLAVPPSKALRPLQCCDAALDLHSPTASPHLQRQSTKRPSAGSLVPPLGPAGFAQDADKLADYKLKEIKNGRLAMVAFLGFIGQKFATGERSGAALSMPTVLDMAGESRLVLSCHALGGPAPSPRTCPHAAHYLPGSSAAGSSAAADPAPAPRRRAGKGPIDNLFEHLADPWHKNYASNGISLPFF